MPIRKVAMRVVCVCCAILAYDGYVLAGKIAGRRQRWRAYNQRAAAPLVASPCQWVWEQARIYIPGGTDVGAGHKFAVKLEGRCSTGASAGCGNPYGNWVLTQVDTSTCQKTVVRDWGAFPAYQSAKCGQQPLETGNPLVATIVSDYVPTYLFGSAYGSYEITFNLYADAELTQRIGRIIQPVKLVPGSTPISSDVYVIDTKHPCYVAPKDPLIP